MLRRLIERLYLSIKQRPISLDRKISSAYLARFLVDNFFGLFRGWAAGYKYVFVGKGSVILGRSSCTIGKGSKIGRSCVLDGIGTQGLIIGPGCSIADNCIIKVSGTMTSLGLSIELGEAVGLGDFAHLGGAGGLSIGEHTIIGPYFSCHPENHKFLDKDSLIKDQGVTRVGIKIGRDCWIGAKVTVLDGAVIGDGSVVAAGAVVAGEFSAYSIIGGIPAKVIKGRFDDI